MLEVLIATALGTIVLAGTFDVYVSSTKSLMGQTNAVQMQADTKAALDYMVRELRMATTAYAPLAITATLATNDTITFARGEESGYSSGGNTATTLGDTSKSWTVNKFAPTAQGSYTVWIKTGAGVGESHPIQSNTATTLALANGWTTIPDTTSLYFIVRTKAFTLFADKTLRYSINGGAYNLLARNVTALSFSQANPCNATTVCVTLTARSKDPDPLIGQYLTYTMTNTARPRN